MELLKILAADETFGFDISGILDSNEAWRKYKNQNHDLFLTTDQKVDYFLTEGNTDAPQLLTWSGTVSKTSEATYTKRLMAPSARSQDASKSDGGDGGGASTTAPPSPPKAPATTAPKSAAAATPPEPPAAQASASEPASTSPAKGKFDSTVTKYNGSILLDLGEKNGKFIIQRIKRETLPAGVPHPADAAKPPLLEGDILVAVNDAVSSTLKDFVLKIRGTAATLKFTVQRD